jgi:hypothetical protein
LPAIGGAFGSELFATRELFTSEAAAVRLVVRGLNARQAGRLLRRATGQAIDGYMVQRESIEAGAVLWCVVKVPEFPGVQNPFKPLATPDTRR